MPGREIDEQVLHDHVVRLLHVEYYNYPSERHPYLMAFVNHPSKTKAVHSLEGQECFPDIVVVHAGSEKLELVAEVETESTVDVEEAREWDGFRRLGSRFHLYFPRGCGSRVAELCPAEGLVELVQYWKEGERYVIERFAGGGIAPPEPAPVDIREALRHIGAH